MKREEVREKAFEDYRNGMKYQEIADKYGVSLSAVKSWAMRYWKKDSCNHKTEKLQPKKKKVATRGARLGNKNAVGNDGGAPPGNKNALKTGEFETLLFDTLEEDEKLLLDLVQPDKQQLLIQEIRLLTVRERRMLKRIEALHRSIEYAQDGNPVEGFTAVSRKTGLEKDKMTDLTEYRGKLGQIQAVEDALTRVQARKQHAIDALHRYGIDDAKLEIELKKLKLSEAGKETTEDEDTRIKVNIYLPEKEPDEY